MDISLIIACSFILGFPALAVIGAYLFLPDVMEDPYEDMQNWGSQDTDQRNLNK